MIPESELLRIVALSLLNRNGLSTEKKRFTKVFNVLYRSNIKVKKNPGTVDILRWRQEFSLLPLLYVDKVFVEFLYFMFSRRVCSEGRCNISFIYLIYYIDVFYPSYLKLYVLYAFV